MKKTTHTRIERVKTVLKACGHAQKPGDPDNPVCKLPWWTFARPLLEWDDPDLARYLLLVKGVPEETVRRLPDQTALLAVEHPVTCPGGFTRGFETAEFLEQLLRHLIDPACPAPRYQDGSLPLGIGEGAKDDAR